MQVTDPIPNGATRTVRVLIIVAQLQGRSAETEICILAKGLNQERFQFEVMPCRAPDQDDDRTLHQFAAAGIQVDLTAKRLSFDETVTCIRRKTAGCDILMAIHDVPELYLALAGLHHRPPLIEYGRSDRGAAGAQNVTARYVDADSAQTAQAWESLFDDVLAERPVLPPPQQFRSFMQGGFECSMHVLNTGRRLDVIASTDHDRYAYSDYRQLAAMGLLTVRDAARWHLIEKAPGRFDFSTFLPMADAAQRSGTQVIWDLLHYGWPEDIDIWSAAFVPRFADFARALAHVWRETTDEIPFWCPVNEISFFAWAGGDVAYFNPFATGRGFELKVQLAHASIAATQALRDVDARARFVQCEPLVAVHHDPQTGPTRADAEGWHEAQFQAMDMLTGQIWPQIGGDQSMLDILGVNYYPRNQWIHGGNAIDVDHPAYRPLSDLLFETYARFNRPILISETGVEDDRRASWLRYVAGEVAHARQRGIPVEGICLYPIVNHLGWDNDRLCQNGLLTLKRVGNARGVHLPLFKVVAELVAGYSDPSMQRPRSASRP